MNNIPDNCANHPDAPWNDDSPDYHECANCGDSTLIEKLDEDLFCPTCAAKQYQLDAEADARTDEDVE